MLSTQFSCDAPTLTTDSEHFHNFWVNLLITLDCCFSLLEGKK